MKFVADRKVILCILTVIAGLALILGISRYMLFKKLPHETKKGEYERLSADTSQENVKENKPPHTITDELYDVNNSYLQQGTQDLTHLEDSILKQIDLQVEQIELLNNVLAYDRKKAAKFDIPEKDLATTQSDVLCKHFARSPIRVWFGMHDDRNMGITRALRASNTLATLFGREDIIPAIVKVYQETPIEPEKMGDLEPGMTSMSEMIGLTSMSLMITDEFLMYPPVFEKVAGYEKQILSALCDRYRRMEKVNSSNPDTPVYGAIYNSTKNLTLLLLERMKPSLYNSLVSEMDYSKLITQVENVLREMN